MPTRGSKRARRKSGRKSFGRKSKPRRAISSRRFRGATEQESKYEEMRNLVRSAIDNTERPSDKRNLQQQFEALGAATPDQILEFYERHGIVMSGYGEHAAKLKDLSTGLQGFTVPQKLKQRIEAKQVQQIDPDRARQESARHANVIPESQMAEILAGTRKMPMGISWNAWAGEE